jgi:hypothetical protein
MSVLRGWIGRVLSFVGGFDTMVEEVREVRWVGV